MMTPAVTITPGKFKIAFTGVWNAVLDDGRLVRVEDNAHLPWEAYLVAAGLNPFADYGSREAAMQFAAKVRPDPHGVVPNLVIVEEK